LGKSDGFGSSLLREYFWAACVAWMSLSEDNARHAKAMLGDTGTIERVAAIAVVAEGLQDEEWIVTSIGSGGEALYQTIFTGPSSMERALEYAAEKYSGYRLICS
jgi:hypothetical protein